MAIASFATVAPQIPMSGEHVFQVENDRDAIFLPDLAGVSPEGEFMWEAGRIKVNRTAVTMVLNGSPEAIDDFEIGHGSYGVLIQGEDVHTGLPVAVKFFTSYLDLDEEEYESFMRQLQERCALLEQLPSHPHVVPTRLSYFPAGDGTLIPVIVMPWVDGGNCTQFLDEAHKLSLGELLDLAEQIAVTLDWLHANGIRYSDLKPSNILIRRDAQGRPIAVLGDMDSISPIGREEEFFSLRSEGYAARELERESLAELGPHTDQYALAVFIRQMIILDESPKSFVLNPNSRFGVEAVLAQALRHNTRMRHQSCMGLVVKLREAIRQEYTPQD